MDQTSPSHEPLSRDELSEGNLKHDPTGSPDTSGDQESEAGTNAKDHEGSENSEDIDTAEPKADDFTGEGEHPEEYSDLSRRVSSIAIGELPILEVTGFSVPLPLEIQHDSNELPNEVTRPLAPLPEIIHVSEILKPTSVGGTVPGVEGAKVAHVGLEAGLTGSMQATYLFLPPGTRSSRPVAQRLGDSITYCISGRGLLWQNGWTFPFEATDCAGWKGGTGIAHTIINDSNRDGGPGEDLILITAHEIREGESFSYPLDRDVKDADNESEGNALWRDPPVQGEFGPHPGVPSVSPESAITSLPEPQRGYRPSNVINAIAELEGISAGELFANATSLSQETGLSGRIGCNFEVPPPGARSSDPHAHSLEDELVYIISGNGLVWINGDVHPVREGDAVGFPGGTGVAHNFINDSNADGAEGDPLILWIIGQNRVKDGDLIYYPLHVNERSESKRWWAGCPKYNLGNPTSFVSRYTDDNGILFRATQWQTTAPKKVVILTKIPAEGLKVVRNIGYHMKLQAYARETRWRKERDEDVV